MTAICQRVLEHVIQIDYHQDKNCHVNCSLCYTPFIVPCFSSGLQALRNVGVLPEEYFACEKDPWCKKVSRYHYGESVFQLGEVRDVDAGVVTSLGRVDLLIGGRKTFAGPLLDKEYERVMESVKSDISKAKALTIETDGWTNTRTEGIVNFFGAGRVLLLVTDNASAMKRAWRLDITKLPVFRDLISSAKDVVKIRKHRQLNAIFKSKQKLNYGESASALVLPSPTRFGGSYLMLVSLQKNKVALGETVLTDATEVPAAVKTTVLDDAFWEKMSFFLRFMKPVVEGTHLIEADDAKLSHMVKICMKIKDLANEALNEDSVIPLGAVQRIKSAVIHRITKFCIFDIHLATYLIDPVFAGEGLSDTECQRAIEVIEAIAAHLKENTEKVVENLAQFTTKTNFYDNEKMWKRALTLNSITWWDFYCKNQPLHPIAVRLLSLLPSACPCERIWSEYGYVHNKVRNRLNNKKVEKEVAIKHNLNLSQQCSEAEKKKRAELSAEREKILKAYPSVFLFDESDSEFSEDENDPRPLWTSDEELENTSDEENEEDLENISD
ncbi:uncharacterized protein LOC113218381 [Frankliniella occidentalis]|uniref:Uncharacterized protein LOC113218381 n=1 Tax=Frankliniella occidentalis TaxID=133901 RepID=A0A9C6X7D3_FRAOC|nr:uncharacterized protein LOC113218381 [Frankliniella occidentalis]